MKKLYRYCVFVGGKKQWFVYPDLVGEKNHQAKLQNVDIEKMHTMFLNRISYEDIAKTFGITETSVRRIRSGKLWRHKFSASLLSVSNKEKEAIRMLRKQSYADRYIATKLKLSVEAVKQVK